MLAVGYGHVDCVNELLRSGANVLDEQGPNMIDYYAAKCTPLQIACLFKQLQCVQALLAANAPLNIVQKALA